MSVLDSRTPAERVRETLEIPDEVALRRIVVEPNFRSRGKRVEEGAWVRIETYVEGGPPIEVCGWVKPEQADAIAFALDDALCCGIYWPRGRKMAGDR